MKQFIRGLEEQVAEHLGVDVDDLAHCVIVDEQLTVETSFSAIFYIRANGYVTYENYCSDLEDYEMIDQVERTLANKGYKVVPSD